MSGLIFFRHPHRHMKLWCLVVDINGESHGIVSGIGNSFSLSFKRTIWPLKKDVTSDSPSDSTSTLNMPLGSTSLITRTSLQCFDQKRSCLPWWSHTDYAVLQRKEMNKMKQWWNYHILLNKFISTAESSVITYNTSCNASIFFHSLSTRLKSSPKEKRNTKVKTTKNIMYLVK